MNYTFFTDQNSFNYSLYTTYFEEYYVDVRIEVKNIETLNINWINTLVFTLFMQLVILL